MARAPVIRQGMLVRHLHALWGAYEWILERLQQHASSSSSSTSASASTSTSASTSALASSAFASSVSSSSSAGTTGGGGGSINGVSGGVSPVPPSASGSTTVRAPGSAGNTSPQLPSPAGSGSTTSTTSLRGTVDQNPPINTLYVGNLPTSPPPTGYQPDYLEETLREVFSGVAGFRKLCFRHKLNGPMCFVEFEDVPHASRALALMSGNTLNGAVKNGIRLSYSKNPLGVRTPNAPNSAGGHNSNGSSSSQVQQALTSSNQYQQHGQGQGPPPSSASSDTFQNRMSDDFGGHPHHRLPTSILRRDSTLSPTSPTYSNGSGNGSNQNSFFSSPPPRFYSSVSPGRQHS
ncbi:hypothetical protein BJ912DRAFT_5336 [Pholiota molesta]|nr:hypothetical protein BJ912DRAFT_5336 [Pholiota molesta]